MPVRHPDVWYEAKLFLLFKTVIDVYVARARYDEEEVYYIRYRAVVWYDDSVDSLWGSHRHLNIDMA